MPMNIAFARVLAASVIAALAVIFATPARADEVDALLRQFKAPAVFKDYVPDFSWSRQTFSFEHLGGPQKSDWWVIKDHDRYVAVIPLDGFHSGTFFLRVRDPNDAPKELTMPTQRWHIDTALGYEMRTDAWIPNDEGAQDSTYRFTKGEGTLTLIRQYKGTAHFTRWTHGNFKRNPETLDVTNTFVLRCDAITGYTIEGTFDTRVSPARPEYDYGTLAQNGRYSIWPGTETCFRTLFTPKAGGYVGYYMNQAAIADSGGGRYNVRDGGFAAFLNDQTGWSTAVTLEGGDARIIDCNVHANPRFFTAWPKDAKPDADGLTHHVVKHRLVFLPPLVTKHLWDAMKVDFGDRKKVIIRMGQTEDFEDQPLPYTTRVRGLSFTSEPPEITDKFSHSGKKSMVVPDGGVWPNLPQIDLQPNTKYRVEAWVKLVPFTAEQLAAKETKEKARIEAERKKGKTVEDFKGLGEAAASLSVAYYEWSPYADKMLDHFESNKATAATADWQHISLEFTAPSWGPFANLWFGAKNCTVYLDDFKFAPVDTGK